MSVLAEESGVRRRECASRQWSQRVRADEIISQARL
jgi:hypothetical protein